MNYREMLVVLFSCIIMTLCLSLGPFKFIIVLVLLVGIILLLGYGEGG